MTNNLWESWYDSYQAAQTIETDLADDLSMWSAEFAQRFVLGAYAEGIPIFPILPFEALSLLSLLYHDGIDIDMLIDLAEEYSEIGDIKIPVQWLADPQEMARIHTAWAHSILHEEEAAGFGINIREDLDQLPPEERICWLLSTAEFILETSALLDELACVRVDTWAKLMYTDKMIQATGPLLINELWESTRQHQAESASPESKSLASALSSYCRIDQFDVDNNLIHGPQVSEHSSEELAATLTLLPSTEKELALTIEQLYLDSDESKISSTYLSDTQRWLEGAIFHARLIVTDNSEDQLQGDPFRQLQNRLNQAVSLARINALLSAEERGQIRKWASNLIQNHQLETD